MYLSNRIATVFSAQGALATAAADGMERAGATVHRADRAAADVLDEAAIEHFLRRVHAKTGRIDVVFNGVGPRAAAAGTGTTSTALDYSAFTMGMNLIIGGQLLTARTAARLWMEWGQTGTIVLLTSSLSRLKMPNATVISTASAAVEGLARTLAAEYGRHGIRVACVNGTAFPETETIRETAALQARAAGIPAETMLEGMQQGYSLGRGPTLTEFGDLVALLASDSGAILNSHIIDADRGALNVL